MLPAPEGEYFENGRFAGLVARLFGCDRGRRSRARALSAAFLSPVQFSFSWLFAFCIFLHALRRLSLLDHRASRDRCGMVRVVRRQLENHCRCFFPFWQFSSCRCCFCGIIFIDWMNIPPGAIRRLMRSAPI